MKWLQSKKLWMLIGIVVIVTSLIITNNIHQESLVQEITANVTPETQLSFYRSDQVVNHAKEYLEQSQWLRRPASQIPIEELEQYMLGLPGIKNCNVSITLRNDLNISVEQQEPILRIKNIHGKQFYLDTDGQKFDIISNYTAHVPIASGWVDESMDSILYTIGAFVHENTFWKAQLEQIFVTKARSIVLIPKWGNHRILLGEAMHFEEKLETVKSFYKQALNQKGWDQYKTIDVRYNGKIYCK